MEHQVIPLDGVRVVKFETLRKPEGGGVAPVRVEFGTVLEAESIFRNRLKLKETKLFVGKDFTFAERKQNSIAAQQRKNEHRSRTMMNQQHNNPPLHPFHHAPSSPIQFPYPFAHYPSPYFYPNQFNYVPPHPSINRRLSIPQPPPNRRNSLSQPQQY